MSDSLPAGVVRRRLGDVGVLQFLAWDIPGMFHAFTLRRADDNAPELSFGGSASPEVEQQSRERLARALKFSNDTFYRAEQVHGARVVELRGTEPPGQIRSTQTDALLTTTQGVTIAVAAADCVPVLFTAGPGRIAATHAGWRGIVGGVLNETVERLIATSGGNLGDVRCLIGPCIGVNAYEIGEDVAAQFAALPHAVERRPTWNRPHLNLQAAAQARLIDCGVDRNHIARVPLCTFERPDLFFSFRCDGSAAGRQLGVIGLAS